MANQREIAAALGMTQATVSRALSGSPLVKEDTRRLVEETARRLGYKANPLVATLMEHIRAGRQPHDRGTIAVIYDMVSNRHPLYHHYTFRQQREGYSRMADRWGFRTELFFRRHTDMSDEVIDRILYARGVTGVILAAPADQREAPPKLHWDRYAVATVSYAWSHLTIDRASSDHRQNIAYAFDILHRRGYRRIGLVLPSDKIDLPQGSFYDANPWLGGYLACQYLLPHEQQLPIFFYSDQTGPPDLFRAWLEQCRPDVLMGLTGDELHWMRALGIDPRRQLPLVCLNRPAGSSFAGIEENNEMVGELTAEIVVNHIIHNERGLPATPRLLLVRGTWIEGETLPENRPRKSYLRPGRRRPAKAAKH